MDELERLAGATLCVGFPGGTAQSDVLRELAALGPCGVVLFARNVSTLDATRALVGAVSDAIGADAVPPLICVDQEGGPVARLRFGEVVPAPLALGATGDETLAERSGKRLAWELARVGANLNFAPVLDLALSPNDLTIGMRAFGDDPSRVAALGSALIRGLQTNGVAATAKHFPGYGDSARDPHLTLPEIATDRTTLCGRDLVPFGAAIAAQVQAVMSAHVVVRAIGPQPATLSRAILHDLLRTECGFSGVTFTDCLEMGAIAHGVGASRAAVLALAAGADALVVSHDLDVARAARDEIVAATRRGELSFERLQDAVRRTNELRGRLAADADRRAALAAQPADDVPATIAGRAIALIRGDARLPAALPVTVVSFEGVTSEGIAAASGERPSLSFALRRLRRRSESLRVPLAPDAAMCELLFDVIRAQRAQGARALVVIARRAHLYEAQRAAIDALLALEPAAIAVSGLEPFDVPALTRAQTLLCSFGDELANVEALAAVLTGNAAPRGSLPIVLPSW